MLNFLQDYEKKNASLKKKKKTKKKKTKTKSWQSNYYFFLPILIKIIFLG